MAKLKVPPSQLPIILFVKGRSFDKVSVRIKKIASIFVWRLTNYK